jgi:hypothetical protein
LTGQNVLVDCLAALEKGKGPNARIGIGPEELPQR